MERQLSDTAFARFVDYLVHEMRNPLFGISSTLDAWEPNLGSTSDQLEYLNAARGAVERMRTILQNLAVWTRPIRLERTPCDISGLLIEAVRGCEELADQRNVALLVRIEPALPTVLVDADHLLGAITAVVEVAVTRSPEGSSVEVMGSGDSGAGSIVLSVRDHALHSGTEEIEGFFEPFRARRTSDGGLGLAIARRIVEAHGGVLTARFVSDGTLFTVRINRHASEKGDCAIGSQGSDR